METVKNKPKFLVMKESPISKKNKNIYQKVDNLKRAKLIEMVSPNLIF
jgi:hypothetical protein